MKILSPDSINKIEPPPEINTNRDIADIVIEDYLSNIPESFVQDEIVELLKNRKSFGLQKYGVALQAFNGRNPLNDAIQEKEDFIFYICQAIQEGLDVDDNLKDVYIQGMRDLEIIYMVLDTLTKDSIERR